MTKEERRALRDRIEDDGLENAALEGYLDNISKPGLAALNDYLLARKILINALNAEGIKPEL